MDINKGLLFLDGKAYNTTAKILDLGFCGDFDYKNFAWNRFFVAFPAKSTGTDLTVKVFTCQNEYSAASTYAVGDLVIYNGTMYRCTTAIGTAESWTSSKWSTTLTDSALCSLVVPQAKVRVGAQMAFNAPVGLKRYVTIACSVAADSGVAPDKVTIGFTQDVDTDCIANGGGIDWTNYKADTFGTALKGTPMQNVADVIAEGADAAGTAASLMTTHEAKSVGDISGTAHVQST